jgi:hypothetical protein
MILFTARRGNNVCLCRSVHPLFCESAEGSMGFGIVKLTFSSPEFPSMTHHSTIPSDLPIYTFLSYPSTQFTSFLGPSSSLVAGPFAIEADTDAVEVAFRPAEVARDAAVPNNDPEVAGGEDGPGISRDFELCCYLTYLLPRNLINLCGSTNLIRVVVYERALPEYLSSFRYNHAL